MQVILEKENREILDEKLYFGAMERTKGELKVEAVQEEPDYIILRLEGIPEDWKEISLRVGKYRKRRKYDKVLYQRGSGGENRTSWQKRQRSIPC